jgi:hypothetical protein
LWDISESGARIAAPRTNFLPPAFDLLLAKDGSSRRVCRVVWRNEGHVGVQFVQGYSAEDMLESISLRRQPKVIEITSRQQESSVDSTKLFLPGYGAQFLEKPDRRGIPISSVAAVLAVLLALGTAVIGAAAMQSELSTPWAVALCSNAANFCEHPEWTGVASALMGGVYLAVRGMEV